MEKSNTQSVMDESYMCIQINRFFQQENVSRETFSCLLLHSVSKDRRACVLGCEPGFWVVSCCSRHIRITTRTQQTLMLLIISELTQNRIWISECIYELYVYIFNPYPILVRSAYYYVAKCWRAPRTCLQS